MTDQQTTTTWISARDAAERFSYTSDYITYLCRTGKVTARRESKLWLIELTSLQNFYDTAKALEEERRAKLREARKVEYNVHAHAVTAVSAVAATPALTKTYAGAMLKIAGVLVGVAVFLFGFSVGTYAFPNEFGHSTISAAFREFVNEFPEDSDTNLAAVFGSIAETVSASPRPVALATESWSEYLGRFFWITPYEPPLVVFPAPPRVATTTRVVRATESKVVVQSQPQTVVRNVSQYVTVSGVTRAELDAALALLEQRIVSRIPTSVTTSVFQGSPSYTPVTTQSFAQSQRIDVLDGVIIRNATITGGSISGTSGLSTGSGNVGAGTIGQLAFYEAAGSTLAATSTLFISSTELVGVGTSTPNAKLSVYGDLMLSGASRYINFGDTSGVLGYGIRDNAGTLEFKNAAGFWASLGAGGSGGGSWSTTTSQVAGQLINYPNNASDIVTIGSNSTTTAEYWFDPNANIATLTGRVVIANASTTFLTSSYASTSNQVISNSLTIGALSGFLKATAGTVGTSLINLAADVTGTLPAGNGGTGLATIASSSLLIGGPGNTWIQFATSSLGIAISDTTGTLAINRGGTNASSFTTTGNSVYFDGTSLVTAGGTSVTTPYASSTYSSFGTASSSALTVSGIGSATNNIVTVTPTGAIGASSLSALGAATFAFPYTPATAWNATSTIMLNTAGLISTASSSIAQLSTVNITTTNATTTNLSATYASTTGFTLSSLLSGRIPFATTGGQFTSNAFLTFSGSSLVANYASSTALSVSGTGYFDTASTTNLTVSALNAANCDVKSSSTGVFSCGTDATGNDKWATTTGAFLGIAPNAAAVVGIGTSTPRALLHLATSTAPQLALSDGFAGTASWGFRSISGNLLIATTSASTFATSTIPALSISGDGFGTTTLRGLTISGVATSTSNVGFNVTDGCYAIDNVCITGGGGLSGSGASNKVAYWSGASTLSYSDRFNWDGTTNRLGVGTTSPWTTLSVHAQATDTLVGNKIFVVASSTSNSTTTLFSISNTGQATIGDPTSTANQDALFQLGSDSNAWTFGYNAGDKSFRLASSTDLATSSTFFNMLKGGYAAFGTTSAYARLSVWGNALDATLFQVVNSASTTKLAVTDANVTLPYASSTYSSFGTASSSALTVSGIGSATNNIVTVTPTGAIGASSLSALGAATFAFPYTPATSWNATSTIMLNTAGLISTASSSIAQLSTINITTTNATTTNLSATFASTTGFTLSSLLSGRIPFATTGGQFTSNAFLTFSGSSLVAPYASTTNITSSLASTTNLTVSALNAANCDVKSSSTGVFSCGTDATGNDKWATTTDNLGIYTNLVNAVVGIGTTSPRFALTIASSTAPQLALTDGSSTNSPWTFRSVAGNLYIATSSPSNFATSTSGSTTIAVMNTGSIGFGTSSPGTRFAFDGQGFGSGGNFFVVDGNLSSVAGGSAPGAGVLIRAGYSSSGAGGNVVIVGGSTSGSTNGGNISITGGASNPVTGSGSTVTINGGVGGGSAPNNYGLISLASVGGSVSLVSGGGAVGIATTTSSGAGPKLAVNGNTVIAGDIFARTFQATSTQAANIFTYASTTMLTASLASSTDTFISSLLSGRIPFATTGGQLTSNAFLTFSGSSLVAPFASTTNITATVASTTGLVISGTGGNGTRCLQTSSDGTVSAAASACGSGGGVDNNKFATTTDNLGIYVNSPTNPLVGIGTTSPRFTLTIASSTAPQLALTDGSSTNSPWTFRSIMGNLFIATSSPSNFTTSTVTSLLTLTGSGSIGVSTSSPIARFAVDGNGLNSVNSTANYVFAVDGGQSTAGVGRAAGILLKAAEGGGSGAGAGGNINLIGGSGTNSSDGGAVTLTGGTGDGGGGAITLTAGGGGMGGGADVTITAGNGTFGSNAGSVYIAPGSQGYVGKIVLAQSSGVIGIGTSTPSLAAKLTISTSTTPQLSLADGFTTSNPWTFRSIMGAFYLATSSAATGATSTVAALAIDANGAPSFGALVGSGTSCAQLTASGALTRTGTACGAGGGVDNGKWATTTGAFLGIAPNAATVVGIGTTTPRALLHLATSTAPQLALSDGFAGTASWGFRAISGNLIIATTSASTFATSTIPALSISGDGFGTTTLRGLNISGVASSTSNVGINITSGCFAINNTCVGGGGGPITGSGSANRVGIWDTASNITYNERFVWDVTTGRLGIGSTTPYARLSVHAFANDAIISNTLFAIASSTQTSTSTLFSVLNNGQTIIGDQASTANLDAPIQVGQDWNAWTFGYNSADKSFRIASSTDLATSSTKLLITKEGLVGIGTTTPRWQLTVASTSAPQLALTDGSLTSNPWTFRSAGGSLYIATSSASTFATSSITALTITENGAVGIGTTTPSNKWGATFASYGPIFVGGASTTATSTFMGNVHVFGGLKVGSGSIYLSESGIQTTASSTFNFANGSGEFQDFSFNNDDLIVKSDIGAVGIGTTSPLWALTVSSSTAPQFALTDGSLTSDRWTWRNAGGNMYFATSSASSFSTTTLSAFTVIGATGNVGIGSSSPFAKLSVIGGGTNANGTNPSFVVATTSDWFGALGQRPLLWVSATTTGALDYARVAIGTTSPWGNSGLRDQFTVDGRMYSTWRYVACDIVNGALAQTDPTGDTVSFCGGFSFDEDTDANIIETTNASQGSYAEITPGQATVGQTTGDGGVVRLGAPFVSATSSPVMEAWGMASTSLGTSTPFYLVGLYGANFGAQTETTPTNGAYFAASTSNNWIAITRANNVETRTVTNIQATTTNLTQQYKFRVELNTNEAIFLINGQVVARHTTNIPSANLTPAVLVSILTSSTGGPLALAPRFKLSLIRFWMDDPPGSTPPLAEGGGFTDMDLFDPVDGADIAESYLTEPSTAYIPGMVVAHSATTSYGVRKSAGKYDSDVFGVVATSPRLVLGDEASTTVRVGMLGRVPTIVSLANGPIKIGSRVTASDAEGVGMRAGRPGSIVGRAVVPFDPANGVGTCDTELKSKLIEEGVVFTNPDECVGLVMVALDPGVDMTIGNMLQDAQEGILTLTDAVAALTNTAFEQGAELTKFVAGQVVAQLGIFDKIFAKEVHTEKLCVGEVCVTETEFLQMLQGAAGNAGGGGEPEPETPSADGAPTIEILGNNPATVEVGQVYADLGVVVTDDTDANVPLVTLVDGVEVLTVTIDTSVAGEHTVLYRATDTSGNVTEVTRTVTVVDPAPPAPEPEPEVTPEPQP